MNASDKIVFKRNDANNLVAHIELLCGVDDAEVLNINTVPSHRRRGLAHSLLLEAIDWARDNQRHALWLEVRVGNVAAIALYRRVGFKQMSTRVRYYAGLEDALVMKYTL